ncbi:GNAT family N-acetyltransferase [Cohnella boryungensis]|uniref:GNAT family N-acetyltransferase n=2 Tax=Cohnella boryungensis TaxID=768479 RepID=A0ABV8SLF5_9BACL
MTNRWDDPLLRDLLQYSIYSDAENVEDTIAAYMAGNGRSLYGYEEEGELIGIVGFAMNGTGELKIEHLAVEPDFRGLGYGRGLVLEALDKKKPALLTAETDEDAVNFYRSIGFEIESLGELCPGVERFKCIYTVDSE